MLVGPDGDRLEEGGDFLQDYGVTIQTLCVRHGGCRSQVHSPCSQFKGPPGLID